MGDKPGHPFRGNQYADAARRSEMVSARNKIARYAEAGREDVARAELKRAAADLKYRAQLRLDEFAKRPTALGVKQDAELMEAAAYGIQQALDKPAGPSRATLAKRRSQREFDRASVEDKAVALVVARAEADREARIRAGDARARFQGVYVSPALIQQTAAELEASATRKEAPDLDHLKRENAMPAKISDVPAGGKGAYDAEVEQNRDNRKRQRDFNASWRRS
jgi:hypothetical protein